MTTPGTKRIQWTDQEWDDIFTLVDGTKPITSEVYEKQGILPKDRWRNEISIQTSKRVIEAKFAAWKDAREFLSPPAAPAQPPTVAVSPVAVEPVPTTDALTSAVWSVFEPRLRSLIREEIALGLLGRQDVSNALERRSAHLKANIPPAKSRDLIKVDVVGLLPSQVQQVEASDIGKRMDLRFIEADKSTNINWRPNVVLVTKFVSHYTQEAIKGQGSHIVYANGAAGSVIIALERLFVELADVP